MHCPTRRNPNPPGIVRYTAAFARLAMKAAIPCYAGPRWLTTGERELP